MNNWLSRSIKPQEPVHHALLSRCQIGVGFVISFAVLSFYNLLQTAVVVLYSQWLGGGVSLGGFDGNLLTLVIGVSTPIALLVIWQVSRLQIYEAPVHFGWCRFSLARLMFWLVVLAGFILSYPYIAQWFDQPAVNDFVIQVVSSSNYLALTALAVVLLAPVFEEVFFRGYLISVWQQTSLGAWGSILLTSLIWSLIHFQYDVFEISVIFVFGLILGMARIHSGSIWVPLIMHCVFNGVTLVLVMSHLNQGN
ncbi:CPBP family intramembrane glutamic endopeptidase [Pleionea sp. CnH1-48]|uniref:CPBP family intramembrane glutamic endopeptidase n=1 Tax=Pleionea sp. CnH1-48 TaxID=2954494 RepID=UPI002097A996|nr:type II CAAX endopeptidase family protein [Pleionea sp. CnH1-48]MCO7225505.1 CPBP family intramembrane metalloprotease [Pleionea sp. CnH1-48]